MDTWFTNEPFIHNILSEGLDVIGMLKDSKPDHCHGGIRLMADRFLAALIAAFAPVDSGCSPHDMLRGICGFGSITVTTKKHGIPVKLVFVRNRNKAGEYIILLTTDCSLRNSGAVRKKWIVIYSNFPHYSRE